MPHKARRPGAKKIIFKWTPMLISKLRLSKISCSNPECRAKSRPTALPDRSPVLTREPLSVSSETSFQLQQQVSVTECSLSLLAPQLRLKMQLLWLRMRRLVRKGVSSTPQAASAGLATVENPSMDASLVPKNHLK